MRLERLAARRFHCLRKGNVFSASLSCRVISTVVLKRLQAESEFPFLFGSHRGLSHPFWPSGHLIAKALAFCVNGLPPPPLLKAAFLSWIWRDLSRSSGVQPISTAAIDRDRPMFPPGHSPSRSSSLVTVLANLVQARFLGLSQALHSVRSTYVCTPYTITDAGDGHETS